MTSHNFLWHLIRSCIFCIHATHNGILFKSIRFWTFTKTPLVCQFWWRSFILTFIISFSLCFCIYHATHTVSILHLFLHSPLQQPPFFNVYENTTGMSIMIIFYLCFCIYAAHTQYRFYICFYITFSRFWTFTKTPVVCQFWQIFIMTFIRILFFS